MKTVFKVIILFLSLILVMAILTACGKKTEDETTTAPSTANTNQTTQTGADSSSIPETDSSSVPETAEATRTTQTESITTAAPVISGKINIPLPEGWTASIDAAKDLRYRKGTANLTVKQDSALAGKNLDAVVSKAKAEISVDFKNAKYIGETEKNKVGGRDAAKLSWTANVSGMDFKYTYIYIPVDNTVYIVAFEDLLVNFDKYLTDIDPILQSVTFS